jgi:hypothetical protein
LETERQFLQFLYNILYHYKRTFDEAINDGSFASLKEDPETMRGWSNVLFGNAPEILKYVIYPEAEISPLKPHTANSTFQYQYEYFSRFTRRMEKMALQTGVDRAKIFRSGQPTPPLFILREQLRHRTSTLQQVDEKVCC